MKAMLVPARMAVGQNQPAAGEPGFMTRAGETCLRALGVALLASVPTALRTMGAGGGFASGLLVGAGALLPVVALALALSRASGRGFRQFIGAREGGAPSHVSGAASPRAAVFGVALWIGVALPLLVALGAVLKATTHHRGIAGATFGVLGLVIVASAALVSQRLLNLGRSLVERGLPPWIPAAVGAAVGTLPLLIVAAELGRQSGDAGAAEVRAAIVDGAIVLVATALVASMELGGVLRRVARVAGVPIALAVFLGAGARIESSPPLGQAFKAGGGLSATILGAFERWTDRDGDGAGSHFGGDDCDEGDPSRHPFARELPGDGIDQDCDGIDPVPASAAAAAGPAVASPRAAAAGTSVDSKKNGRPDIVLVTLDTVRADHTSAYGYDKPTTPNLVEIAKRGVLFEHAYTVGGDTQRALAPLVSGRRFADTPRDKREWPTILPENDTLAERLKRSGYRTAAVTSFTWLSDERGFSQGFDYFRPVFTQAHPEREVTGPLAVKAALSIWKELEADPHPIFLWVHLFDAHERYLAHPGVNFGRGRAGAYDGEVAFVDKQLGEIWAAIAAGPRALRASLIVHGSHGEGFSEHDFKGHGAELYDEVLRVPLVIVTQDSEALKPGRYAEGSVSSLDLAPSILELAGAESDGIEGTSLLPILRGDFTRRPALVYARSHRRAALIDWPLKLMVFERKKNDRFLLFDLAADPGERQDLSSSRPEDLGRLLKARSTFESANK
jgi:choline-sulfatase